MDGSSGKGVWICFVWILVAVVSSGRREVRDDSLMVMFVIGYLCLDSERTVMQTMICDDQLHRIDLRSLSF